MIDAIGGWKFSGAGLEWNHYSLFFAVVGSCVFPEPSFFSRRLHEPEATSMESIASGHPHPLADAASGCGFGPGSETPTGIGFQNRQTWKGCVKPKAIEVKLQVWRFPFASQPRAIHSAVAVARKIPPPLHHPTR